MNRNIHDLTQATAYDRDGEKLGSVKEVYINDSTGQPDFVEVGHGLFGMSSSIVPLRGHRLEGENLQLAFTKDRIQDAPNIRDDDHLSDEDHATIYRHFGLDGTPNSEVYERHVFDDDYDRDLDRDLDRDRHGDRFDHDRDLDRDVRDADLADRRDLHTQGLDRDGVPPAAGAGAAAGTAVHGFGDHAPDGDASADRLRAESDHDLGFDRTPEDRAARGTSAHGMSDEPREQVADYDRDLDRDRDGGLIDSDRDRDLDRDREVTEHRGTRLRRYRVRGADDTQVREGRDSFREEGDSLRNQGESLREQHDPRVDGGVDADGRPLDEGDGNIPRSSF